MKKNITINLFGQLYNIDEDAYELLQKYEQNMRSYFSSKEGGAEIADDIERRVAELFSELKAEGTEAISIEHVEAIIKRIGNPEEMEEEGGEMEHKRGADTGSSFGAGAEKKSAARRQLYRDREDAMIAGVLSGLCRFFGGSDPLPWRIIFVLLAIFSASTLCIIYLVLWAIVPEARTAEDRLRMQGKAVNTENLNEEILRENKSQPQHANQPVYTGAKGCVNGLLRLIVFLCKVAVFAFAGFMLFIVLTLLLPLAMLTFGGLHTMLSWGWVDAEFSEIYMSVPHITWQLWVLAIAVVIAVGLPFFVLLRRLLNPGRKSSSTGKRMFLVVVWILSLVTAVASSALVGAQLEIAGDHYVERLYERDGIYIRSGWSTLDERRWTVKMFNNCNEWITQQGINLFSGAAGREYFHFSSDYQRKGGMRSRIESEKHYPKGRYRLCAVATSSGKGCYIYAQLPGDSALLTRQVPLTNDTASQLVNLSWENASKMPYFVENMSNPSPETWAQVQANSTAQNWAYVETDVFQHPGGTIKYGITNDYEFTGVPWEGSWYNVYDVQLVGVEE